MSYTQFRQQKIDQDSPRLRTEILTLYRKLDKQFGLHAAQLPIMLTTDEDQLGAYVHDSRTGKEGFRFSLEFIGYHADKQLSLVDRQDLYKHEYAHYMAAHYEIPAEYRWQGGVHGSAWKYCCSLVGAAPTPYYKFGEALLHHNYEAALKNPWEDKTLQDKDNYRREQEYKAKKNSDIKYKVGDVIKHPTYGEGTVLEILPQAASVRLKISFSCGEKLIDQAWLIRAGYSKIGDRKKQ